MKYFYIILLFIPLFGFSQYSMDFSVVDTGVRRITADCVGTDPTVCDGYNPGSNWTMSGTTGDEFSLTFNSGANDYVKVVSAGSIETRDPDGDICVDSPPINISALGAVTITVTVISVGTDIHEETDHVDFTYTVDGIPTTLSVNDDFGTQTWTPTVSGNSLTLSVCLDNNSIDELYRLTNVSTNLGSVLPIELISFFASAMDNKKVLINWRTATEINNDYAVVERSSDGIIFKAIGKVEGQGTTFESQDYQFIDESPFEGINYYRLRQVDYDGREEIHKVISIFIEDNSRQVKIYPNPVGQNSDILLSKPFREDAKVQVFSIDGAIVFQGILPADDKNIEIPLESLLSGYYILKITSEGWSVNEKFVKY